nr:MAG: hypothetical protein DIU62_04525 [Pseudomonadota bacterium]
MLVRVENPAVLIDPLGEVRQDQYRVMRPRVGDILSAEQVRELDVLLWADLESVRRALDDGLMGED